MNMLVYGAGVLGSLYAARLQEAGQHVSLLARGQRLQDIREHGILLEDVLTGQTTTTHVKVVEQLGPEDQYDLAVVSTVSKFVEQTWTPRSRRPESVRHSQRSCHIPRWY